MMRMKNKSNHYYPIKEIEKYINEMLIDEEILDDEIKKDRKDEIERRIRIERNYRERVRRKEFFCIRITLAFIAVGVIAMVSGYWISEVKKEVEEKKSALLADAPIVGQAVGPIIYQDWKLRLVNDDNLLIQSILPDMTTLTNGIMVDARIAEELEAMIKAGKSEAGLDIIVGGGYVSRAELGELFGFMIDEYVIGGMSYLQAYNKVLENMKIPGYDERELGLSVNLVGRDYQNLDARQGETATAVWLKENCHRFGFILRYPKEKESITGMDSKSWYYRYVGSNVATIIMKEEICLEEYLGTK